MGQEGGEREKVDENNISNVCCVLFFKAGRKEKFFTIEVAGWDNALTSFMYCGGKNV